MCFHYFDFLLTSPFLWNLDLINFSHPSTFILLSWKKQREKKQTKNPQGLYNVIQMGEILCCLLLEKTQLACGVQCLVPLCFSVFAISTSKNSMCGSWFTQEYLCWDVMLLEVVIFIITINYMHWGFVCFIVNILWFEC